MKSVMRITHKTPVFSRTGSAHLQQIDQLAVSRAHLVGGHDFVPPSQLKHLFVKVGVGGKVTISEELLALLVVGGKDESGEDRAELADLMYDALRFAEAIAHRIDFVGIFGNLQRCIEQAQV